MKLGMSEAVKYGVMLLSLGGGIGVTQIQVKDATAKVDKLADRVQEDHDGHIELKTDVRTMKEMQQRMDRKLDRLLDRGHDAR